MNPLRRIAFLVLLVCLGSHAVAVLAQSDNRWRKLEDCPVLVQNVVEVAAKESGILQVLDVEKNDEVEADVAIAQLDTELVEMELEIAQLQATAARNLAADDSDVKYHEIAQEQAKQEYENHQRVAGSVSGVELRRLKLAYEKSKVSLEKAKQAKIRAGVEAELKQARVRAIQQQLERHTVSSRFSGVVSKVIKRPGQWVEAGQPIVEITDLENLQVDCFFREDSVNLAALVGSQARVEIERDDTKPFLLTGELTSYDPRVSGQGLVRAHVKIKNLKRNGHWLLLPGKSVTLYVNTTEPLLQAKLPSGPGQAFSR